MANLVLYRKYRPKSFSEIVGQKHIVRTLTNAISTGIISHAYLFAGPRGSGKTTIARILAKSLNCQKRAEGEFEPCNKCSSCLEINEGRDIDLIEIDAASNRGIDEIRELKEGIRFVPTKSKYKVFIVDESHQLSNPAANALLKTLEEPPGHAIFILATTEIQKMISTIVSRCQRFDFWKLTLPEIVGRLEWISKKENIRFSKAALELIAVQSGGSMRDAEGLLDQAITFAGTLGREKGIKDEDIKDLLGIVDTCLVSRLTDLLSAKKGSEAIHYLNEVLEKGYDPGEFARTLVRYFRQALILKIMSAGSGSDITSINPVRKDSNSEPVAYKYKIGQGTGLSNGVNPVIVGLTKEEQKKLFNQTAVFKEAELRRSLKLFIEAENKMKYSSIPQLPLELAIIEVIEPSDGPVVKEQAA